MALRSSVLEAITLYSVRSAGLEPLRHLMSDAISRVKVYLQEAEIEKAAKSIVVPTQDDIVRQYLRYAGEPVTLFGEDRSDRRGRLRRLMAVRQMNGAPLVLPETSDDTPKDVNMEKVQIGSTELLEARHIIAKDSSVRSRERLRIERERFQAYKADEKGFLLKEITSKHSIETKLANLTPYGSQSGFERLVSAVQWHPRGGFLVTADWSGKICTFEEASLECLHQSSAHQNQVSALAWNSTGSVLASADWAGRVLLHSKSLETLAELSGPSSRISKLDFHPGLNYVAAASYDSTWRLWDSEAQVELISQGGHAKAVHTVTFNPDGNLLVSGGLDGIGRVWDLRIGKTIMVLDGHLREIYATGWSPTGTQVLTAGGDNNVLVWDLRQLSKSHEIPAHTSIVSDMVVTPEFLATASYDTTVRFWDLKNWDLIRTIVPGEKVLSIDFHDDKLGIGRWDRAIDIYSSK